MVDALGPGSTAPRDPSEVEHLLRRVPEVAFLPPLTELLPAPLRGELSPEAVAAGADRAWLRRLIAALARVEAHAQRTDDGGLRFLAVTLRHFLTKEAIPPAEHPLVVALFVRTAARRDGGADHPATVVAAMNDWPAATEPDR